MDLNGDGFSDILSGSYSRMDGEMAGLFQVLWGKADGTFSKAEALEGNDGEPLIVSTPEAPADEGYDNLMQRICTRPTAVDWDSDGDLDLIVGDFGGTFALFHGEGEGKFQAKSEPVMIGNDVLRISGNHSDPFCVDWDGDGDIDLLSGSTNGGVQWAENTAGPDKLPKLKKFVTLIAPQEDVAASGMLSQADLKGPTRSTRIWVDDLNEDGKLDVLVGDSTTLISAANGLSPEEVKAKEEEWSKKIEEIQTKLNEVDSEEDAEASEAVYTEYSELYAARKEFINEEMTGFVWVYFQE